jgi:hypothetical protein
MPRWLRRLLVSLRRRSERLPICHRSIHSGIHLSIRFINATGIPIQVTWLGYSHMQHLYVILAPGAIHLQTSYLTHPWTASPVPVEPWLREAPAVTPIIVCAETRQQVIYGRTPYTKVTLVKLPCIKWSVETHAQNFPLSYQKVVRTVLLCHHRTSKLDRLSNDSCARLGHLPQASLFTLKNHEIS